MASNLSRIALASARLALADLTSASATFTTLQGQLDPLLVELDCRLLRPDILDQLGHEQGRERVALLDLVADVHVPFLDIARSAWERPTCARRLSMKLGWPTTRTMVRTGGLITCTVGGFETVVNSILASWPQPGAARAAKKPEHELAAAGANDRNRRARERRHQGPPGKGAVRSFGRPGDLSDSKNVSNRAIGTCISDLRVRGVS